MGLASGLMVCCLCHGGWLVKNHQRVNVQFLNICTVRSVHYYKLGPMSEVALHFPSLYVHQAYTFVPRPAPWGSGVGAPDGAPW